MARNKMPKFDSLDKLVQYFDAHDMGDHWRDLSEANFDIDIKSRRHVFALDEDLAERVTQIARTKRVSSRTLINKWLREKVSEHAKPG
jgi:CopG antitoxin of type II toxin-antitoxin system